MTVMYGVYFATGCFLGARGRTILNTSNRIYGCGYLINNDLVKNGWDCYTITEDVEFTTKELIKGTEIRYCDDAVFYDEQPETFRIMWKQRLRWARGLVIVSHSHFAGCIKTIFDPGRKNRFAVYDMATFISCVFDLFIFMFLLRSVLLFFAPLFGENLPKAFLYWDDTRSWWYNLFASGKSGALISFAAALINFCVASMIAYMLTMFTGRKRFRSVSLSKAIIGFFIFSFFTMCQLVLDIQALFSKNLVWEHIPHTGKHDTR